MINSSYETNHESLSMPLFVSYGNVCQTADSVPTCALGILSVSIAINRNFQLIIWKGLVPEMIQFDNSFKRLSRFNLSYNSR
mmetsp:Transcript_7301/g.15689  ORF Transcript_7301/g.15689 Transcript_7301/m.15689 type:complete len:82 (-) Transcript_7301:439-684(-)